MIRRLEEAEEEHRTLNREYNRIIRLAFPERRRLEYKRYRENNPEKLSRVQHDQYLKWYYSRTPEQKSEINKKAREWHARNPLIRRAKHLRKHYGMTIPEFQSLLDKQDGKCAICRRSENPLQVDHCHATNLVRGLLCRACNSGIGHLKDSASIALSAYEYLRQPNTNIEVNAAAINSETERRNLRRKRKNSL